MMSRNNNKHCKETGRKVCLCSSQSQLRYVWRNFHTVCSGTEACLHIQRKETVKSPPRVLTMRELWSDNILLANFHTVEPAVGTTPTIKSDLTAYRESEWLSADGKKQLQEAHLMLGNQVSWTNSTLWRKVVFLYTVYHFPHSGGMMGNLCPVCPRHTYMTSQHIDNLWKKYRLLTVVCGRVLFMGPV